MASDMIGAAVLAITTIIVTAALIAALFPGILTAASSISSSGSDADERAVTSLTIINYDVTAPGRLQFDVLNNGKTSLPSGRINMTTMYLGNDSVPSRLLAANSSVGEPYWTYAIAGDNDVWDPGETLEMSVVSPAYSFAAGDYRLKMVLYNGAICQHTFTIN